MGFNRTKIMVTVGPSTCDGDVLERILRLGCVVVRLNFSHLGHGDVVDILSSIRDIDGRFGLSTCVLGDLQGPKIRVGDVEGGGVDLVVGQVLRISNRDILCNGVEVCVRYANLCVDVGVGDSVLIDDGRIRLCVIDSCDGYLLARVVHGGVLRSRKGVNLPNTSLSIGSITDKDRCDIDFALDCGLDWLALSFVRRSSDILDLREIIDGYGADTKVIAKVERPEALEDIDGIIGVSDGVMVARGDLGVEIDMARVPLVQKSVVEKANRASRISIIATQMMESMISSPVPTRAEVNDVANAVIDGADVLMLSAETAVGSYPFDVVAKMRRTVASVEDNFLGIYNRDYGVDCGGVHFVNDSLIRMSCGLSAEVGARVIVGLTQSGYMAFELSKYRPRAMIFIFTSNRCLISQLNMLWGVRCYYYDSFESTDGTFEDIESVLVGDGHLFSGDVYVSLASMPIYERGVTNAVKVNVVG